MCVRIRINVDSAGPILGETHVVMVGDHCLPSFVNEEAK